MKKTKILSIIMVTLIFLICIGIKSFALPSEYKGYKVIGKIEIPKTDINYPILEKVTQKSLEEGTAFLYGAGINKEGNSVIVGHNYRNEQFFSQNKILEVGDEIYITGMDDVKEKYVIYNKFETTPEDTSFYQIDTNGDKVITLSTATDDTKNRLIIQAKSEGVTDWTADSNNDSANNNQITDGSDLSKSDDNVNTNDGITTDEEGMTGLLDIISGNNEEYEMQQKSNKVLMSVMVMGVMSIF